MRRAALALALLWPMVGHAYTISGSKLLEWCEDTGGMEFACVSYLVGLTDALEAIDRMEAERQAAAPEGGEGPQPAQPLTVPARRFSFCVPADASEREITDAYLSYARNNRPFLDTAATTVAFKAFELEWPCRGSP